MRIDLRFVKKPYRKLFVFENYGTIVLYFCPNYYNIDDLFPKDSFVFSTFLGVLDFDEAYK